MKQIDELDLDALEAVAKAARDEIAGSWTYLDIGEVVLDETDGDGDSAAVIATLCDEILIPDLIGEHIATFDPPTVLKLIAAARPQEKGVEADRVRLALIQMVEAIKNGVIDSQELDGEPEVGIPPHKWHEEWLFYAEAALSEAKAPVNRQDSGAERCTGTASDARSTRPDAGAK